MLGGGRASKRYDHATSLPPELADAEAIALLSRPPTHTPIAHSGACRCLDGSMIAGVWGGDTGGGGVGTWGGVGPGGGAGGRVGSAAWRQGGHQRAHVQQRPNGAPVGGDLSGDADEAQQRHRAQRVQQQHPARVGGRHRAWLARHETDVHHGRLEDHSPRAQSVTEASPASSKQADGGEGGPDSGG